MKAFEREKFSKVRSLLQLVFQITVELFEILEILKSTLFEILIGARSGL